MELLVVVGIIAILIALLLPSLAKARRQAQQVACSANLRQLAAALIAYAMDHRGSFPAPAGVFRVYPEDWVHWQPDRQVTEGSLMRYLGNHSEVLQCPSGFTDRKTQPPYPFSYTLNDWFTGSGGGIAFGTAWTVQPCKLSQCVEAPMKILAIEEEITAINDGEWWADSSEHGINRRTSLSVIHDKGREYGGGPIVDQNYNRRGRGNVVFADGHCDFIPREKLLYAGNTNPRLRGGPH